jgi:hypothetical protein
MVNAERGKTAVEGGVVYTTVRRVTKFGNVLSGRDGKIKPRKLATRNIQNPTSDELVLYGSATGG